MCYDVLQDEPLEIPDHDGRCHHERSQRSDGLYPVIRGSAGLEVHVTNQASDTKRDEQECGLEASEGSDQHSDSQPPVGDHVPDPLRHELPKEV